MLVHVYRCPGSQNRAPGSLVQELQMAGWSKPPKAKVRGLFPLRGNQGSWCWNWVAEDQRMECGLVEEVTTAAGGDLKVR